MKIPAHLRALASTLLLSATASSAWSAPTVLVNLGAKRCLDVKYISSQPGAPVQTWTCSGGLNQLWNPTAAGELRTLNGTRCLDAQGTVPGSPLVSNPCNGQASQQWLRSADNTLRNTASQLCADVADFSTQNGARVQLWNCHALSNQRWSTLLPGTPDTQAPTPPSGLSVSGLTCSSATLSWSASNDNVGVTHYDVYHDGQQMTTVPASSTQAALSLAPGAKWGLYVNARDAAGNVSQASASLQITVPQCSVDAVAPSTPTQFKALATGTSASLTWAASNDNVGVTAYDVYRNGTKVGATPSLQFTDVGLAANTTYSYRVGARDAQNNASPLTATAEITTASGCANTVCSTVQMVTETDLPWGLVTLPDGRILYSRRDAHNIVRMNPATLQKASIGSVPNVQSTDGEGGLLGLAATPGFPDTDPWLYIYHTSPTDNRIVRIQYKNGLLDNTTLQVLLSGIGRNKYHNGGRLRFGPDGKLYASTGDGQFGARAQDLNSLDGKILRLNPDGTRPADNPFGTYVWSYGHRNPQGLAFDSQGRLWAQEFGNSQMDETNLIQKGGNYGWPHCEGTLPMAGGSCSTPGYIAPKHTYLPAQGSCSGLAVVRDVLYVACLRGARMYRFSISGSELTNPQELFSGTYGRLRTVEPSRDGGLFLTTTNAGDKDSTPDNSAEIILKVNLGQ